MVEIAASYYCIAGISDYTKKQNKTNPNNKLQKQASKLTNKETTTKRTPTPKNRSGRKILLDRIPAVNCTKATNLKLETKGSETEEETQQTWNRKHHKVQNMLQVPQTLASPFPIVQ